MPSIEEIYSYINKRTRADMITTTQGHLDSLLVEWDGAMVKERKVYIAGMEKKIEVLTKLNEK